MLVVAAIMFVVVSFFAYEMFDWLYNSLIALNSPYWIWGMFAISFGAILLKEGEEAIAIGVLGSLLASGLAILVHDWLALGVIIAAWGLYAWYKTR